MSLSLELSMLRLFRATCGGEGSTLSQTLCDIGVDSTDIVLAIAGDEAAGFIPGLVAMAWASAPGGQTVRPSHWPGVV